MVKTRKLCEVVWARGSHRLLNIPQPSWPIWRGVHFASFFISVAKLSSSWPFYTRSPYPTRWERKRQLTSCPVLPHRPKPLTKGFICGYIDTADRDDVNGGLGLIWFALVAEIKKWGMAIWSMICIRQYHKVFWMIDGGGYGLGSIWFEEVIYWEMSESRGLGDSLGWF